ncbi:MAG TPA: hypothetical protein VLH09_01195 [Bryobacteraceae bacterium]|nr:hypothetical protein [Bryobacteraceae bacterium]
MAGGLAAAQLPLRGAAGPTAGDIVKQIQERLGGDWSGAGPDGFKAGSPETAVRGIATTAMATMEVLRQAAKAGLNLVVTHEPTFFGSRDGAPPPAAPGVRGGGMGGVSADDPVLSAKRAFIEQNGFVVFRLREHWLARKENDTVAGLADSLGWSARPVPGEAGMFDIPETTAQAAVALIRKRLDLRGGLRAIGDPKARVRRVLLHPGLMPPQVTLKQFDKVDLLVAGEVREWECPTYAADVGTAGFGRNLVTIGRVVSEDPGMRACAAWLRTFVKGVPVEWISSGDPYWRVA